MTAVQKFLTTLASPSAGRIERIFYAFMDER